MKGTKLSWPKAESMGARKRSKVVVKVKYKFKKK